MPGIPWPPFRSDLTSRGLLGTERRTKEAAAAVVFGASLVGIVVLVPAQMASDQAGYGVAVLLLAAICLLSMVALVTFSRTGWRLDGSRVEWGLAIVLNPLALLLWNRDLRERTEGEYLEGRRREDEYYRTRDR